MAGSRSARTPSYGASTGKLWLERGGVYVVANIRGGGEFGPAWHEAGLKTKRQIIYDDFAAVGRDLAKRKITSPRRLGIRGGSNGGLLTGVAFTQNPELWNAVIIDIPLLDMLRISKIAAGASWEGEYGSVDKEPGVREFWQKTLALSQPPQGQALSGAVHLHHHQGRPHRPATRPQVCGEDGRARPALLLLREYRGRPCGGANLKQQARTQALQMVYLTRKLMDPVEPKS